MLPVSLGALEPEAAHQRPAGNDVVRNWVIMDEA
jgi:hypothetical protein